MTEHCESKIYFIPGGLILNTGPYEAWTNDVQSNSEKTVSNFSENENQSFPARTTIEPKVWAR